MCKVYIISIYGYISILNFAAICFMYTVNNAIKILTVCINKKIG